MTSHENKELKPNEARKGHDYYVRVGLGSCALA